jgi:hypothetical protein
LEDKENVISHQQNGCHNENRADHKKKKSKKQHGASFVARISYCPKP